MSIAITNEDRRNRIVLMKGMDLILESLQNHLADPIAAAYMCAALHAFIKDNDHNAEELANLGALEVVGAAMKAHKTAKQVQLFGGLVFEAIKPEDMEDEEDEGEDD